jgi:hypothetical protein
MSALICVLIELLNLFIIVSFVNTSGVGVDSATAVNAEFGIENLKFSPILPLAPSKVILF